VRVRGRARDVGDAEPHHGARAGAQAAQPVPAAAAAVGRQVPPLPGLLDQGRRPAPPLQLLRCWCRGIALPVALFDFSSSLVFGACIYLSIDLARWALRCTSIPPRVSIGHALQMMPGACE
jgi:hypothetical protein